MPINNCIIGTNVKFANKELVNIYGCRIGNNVKIGPFVEIQKNCLIEHNCKISSHSFICEGVHIMKNVFIGHGVTFVNDKYPRATNEDGTMKNDNDWELIKTVIHSGVSIGSGTTILCGVNIGQNALIGAGSVVTKDVPGDKTAYGNPAKYYD